MELEGFDWDEALKGMLEMIDDENKKNNSSSSNQIPSFSPSNFITTPIDETVIPDNPVSNAECIHNPAVSCNKVGRTRNIPFVHSKNRVEGYYLKGLFHINEQIGETSLSQEQCKLSSSTEKPSDFDGEMDNICQQPVEVGSSSQNPHPDPQNVALVEIKVIVSAICRVHHLPLALTWIENEKSTLRIEESACYWTTHMEGFVRACRDQFLRVGQGIAGKALQSDQPMFHANVKVFDINEYPLVEHARKFGLGAAIAIKHRSKSSDCILEFFLPGNIKVGAEQEVLINKIATTMERFYRGLRKVPNIQLLKEKNIKFDVLDYDLQDAQPTAVDDADMATDQMEDDPPSEQVQMAKKRAVNEKPICLSDLEPYYCGSLKYCAQSLGVSPTTVKRVCRQNGIPRWPSRKIQKVNRSLKRIKNVLEGVQGGGLKYDSRSGKLTAIGSLIQLDLSKTLCLAKPTQPSSEIQTTNYSTTFHQPCTQNTHYSQGDGKKKTPIVKFPTFGAGNTLPTQGHGDGKNKAPVMKISCADELESPTFGVGNIVPMHSEEDGKQKAHIVERSCDDRLESTFGARNTMPTSRNGDDKNKAPIVKISCDDEFDYPKVGTGNIVPLQGNQNGKNKVGTTEISYNNDDENKSPLVLSSDDEFKFLTFGVGYTKSLQSNDDGRNKAPIMESFEGLGLTASGAWNSMSLQGGGSSKNDAHIVQSYEGLELIPFGARNVISLQVNTDGKDKTPNVECSEGLGLNTFGAWKTMSLQGDDNKNIVSMVESFEGLGMAAFGVWKTMPLRGNVNDKHSAPTAESSEGLGLTAFGTSKTMPLRGDGKNKAPAAESCEFELEPFGVGNTMHLQGDRNGKNSAPIFDSSEGLGLTRFREWKTLPLQGSISDIKDSAHVIESYGGFGLNTFGAWKTVSLQDDGKSRAPIMKHCKRLESDVFGIGNGVPLQGDDGCKNNASVMENYEGLELIPFGARKTMPLLGNDTNRDNAPIVESSKWLGSTTFGK